MHPEAGQVLRLTTDFDHFISKPVGIPSYRVSLQRDYASSLKSNFKQALQPPTSDEIMGFRLPFTASDAGGPWKLLHQLTRKWGIFKSGYIFQGPISDGASKDVMMQ